MSKYACSSQVESEVMMYLHHELIIYTTGIHAMCPNLFNIPVLTKIRSTLFIHYRNYWYSNKLSNYFESIYIIILQTFLILLHISPLVENSNLRRLLYLYMYTCSLVVVVCYANRPVCQILIHIYNSSKDNSYRQLLCATFKGHFLYIYNFVNCHCYYSILFHFNAGLARVHLTVTGGILLSLFSKIQINVLNTYLLTLAVHLKMFDVMEVNMTSNAKYLNIWKLYILYAHSFTVHNYSKNIAITSVKTLQLNTYIIDHNSSLCVNDMLYFQIHCAIFKLYHIVKTMILIITHTIPECILNLAFSLLYHRYHTSTCLTHLVLQSNPPIYIDLYCIKHIAHVTYTSMHNALYFYACSSELITIAPWKHSYNFYQYHYLYLLHTHISILFSIYIFQFYFFYCYYYFQVSMYHFNSMLYLITSTPYYCLLQYVLSVTSSDVNPITTQHYKWMHLKSKLYCTSIIVMPVLMPDHHELPFMSLSDNEISDSFTPALSQCNDELTTILNNDKIDHTGFADIDPDTNYLIQNTLTDSNYFTETQFNKLQCSNDNFSLFNVNIRSTGAHFDNLRYYLDGLNHKFSVFSITESWLKDYNKDVYNLEGYEHICKIRKNRPGGGVSIYIKNSIKYDIKENLFIDVDGVDSISVEIPKEEFKTQKNSIVTSV